MSTTSTDALLQAYAYIKGDNLTAARTLLGKYLRNNPNSERAWLLMSLAVAEPAQQRDCLQRVLLINPFNTAAQTRLAHLTSTPAPSAVNGNATPAPAPVAETVTQLAAVAPEPISSEAATQPVIEPGQPGESVPAAPAPVVEPPATPRPRAFSGWIMPVIILVWAIIFIVLLGVGAYVVFGTNATPTPPATATQAVVSTPSILLPAPTLPPEWTATPTPQPTDTPTATASPTVVTATPELSLTATSRP
jgi:hypothetical protein